MKIGVLTEGTAGTTFTKLQKFSKRVAAFILSAALLTSCGQSQTTENTTPEAPAAAAQVVLKTQTGPFVLAEKAEVKSEYIAQTKMTVPPDLAPQNKWVMFEGPTLENELIAYRFYLDSRHRSDIFGKKTNALVMDTVGWVYHDIMDWGSDILKVGESLGIGSPAVWYRDSLYTLSDCAEKTVEVVQGAGQTVGVRFTFKGLKLGDETRTIVQLWSLSTGRPHSKVELSIAEGQLPAGAAFATGIVKHLPEAESGTEDGKFYLFSWGDQSFHHQNMGMGIVADTKYQPVVRENPLSHLVVFENSLAGVAYEFAAAWEQDVMGVKSAIDFRTTLLK